MERKGKMNPGKLVTRVFVSGLRFSAIKTNLRNYSFVALSKPLFYHNFYTITAPSCSQSQTILQNFLGKSHVAAMSALSPQDPSSFSRPELAIVRHLSLSLDVDFEKRVLKGNVLLSFDVLEDINEVILDVSKLNIESVELEDNTALKYTVDSEVPNYGAKLTITLPHTYSAGEKSSTGASATSGCEECEHSCCSNCWSQESSSNPSNSKVPSVCETCPALGKEHRDSILAANELDGTQSEHEKQLKIRIKYSTDPKASALQWLEPSQTAGKIHPYLFSQCQPIHARSIVPCQDTPAVKMTYDAEVTAPEEFTVLMSALRGDAKSSKTSFRQPTPIPSYLLAIAVGVLEHRELGPRSKIWTEKEEIERSAWEFAETEKYLQAAENLCGPYVWSQYDLLVLPPSFPYGGMENPCLTFVTPTLLAGDRSQADVIVHEIMHSWTGNLITNRNFEHFWLNEGFTVFLERKVASSLIADPIESKRSRDFHSLLGLQELDEAVNSHLGAASPLTRLVPDLKGVHPDDAFSRVPYEKGSLFLRYLEDLVGGPEVFDDFLRSYLNKFQRKSLDTDQFKEYLLSYFDNNEKLGKVDWNAWLYTSGMPPVIPDYDTSMTKAITALLSKIETNETISYDDVKTFTPHQIIHLLQEMIYRNPLPLDKLHVLGKEYKVAESKNSEIQYRWLRLCVRSKDQAKLQEVFDFVNHQGRMKFVRPLYRDLYAWEDVREQAIDNFLKNEPNMMHVSAYTVRKDLHLTK